MKTCNKCKFTYEMDGFHKDKSKSDGLCTICKKCKIESAKAWAENNPEKVKSIKKSGYARRSKDPSFVKRQREYRKLWRQSKKHKNAAKEAKRRASKKSATPDWLSDEQKAHILRTYKLREFISEVTGETYHVDHIVPLGGKNVCGLHVPWNLRVIPAKHNLKKANKF